MLQYKMKRLWDKYSNIGAREEFTSDTRSKIRISNQLSIVTSLLAVLYFLYVAFTMPQRDFETERIFLFFHLGIALYCIPVLLLNKHGFYILARLFIIVTVSLLNTVNSFFLEQPFRTELYYFVTAAFIFVVFNDWRVILPLYFSQVVLFYIAASNIIHKTPSIASAADGLEFRTFIYFSTLFATLFFLRKETNRYKRKAEQQTIQLSQERDDMEKLNFTKDKIFSIISHDLRNPIGSLKSMLELLKNEHISPEEFKKISIDLNKQVGQLHVSLDEMLTWSKAQLHGINPEPELTLLRPLVQKISTVSKMAARNKKIILTTSISGKTEVFCDPNMLTSVISNLFSNAIKFTSKGGAISLFTEVKNGHVKICIEDTGVGISKENLNKILSKDIHHTTLGTNNEKGTGLGLIMSREFVEKNNGIFSINSKEGQGSIFTIQLPSHN